MTNQQILEKAIQKAIDGGWKFYAEVVANKASVIAQGEFYQYQYPHTWIIFNHDFAKALWGEKTTEEWDAWMIPDWQYHLMQMVIATDPIKYLGEHL